jgi:hypothetical protein
VLSAPVAAAWHVTGHLQDVLIEVVGDHPEIRARVQQFLDPLAPGSTGAPRETLRLSLHLQAGEPAEPAGGHAPGEPIFRYWNVAVFRDGAEHLFVTADGSRLTADLAAGRGWARLAPGLLSARPGVFSDLLLATLVAMLRHRGLFPIHAAALVRESTGHLFLGQGGNGKTSVALALVRSGFRYLADDKVLLTARPDGVAALAVSPRFNIDPEMAGFYPELGVLATLPPLPRSDKRAFDISRLYPGTFAPECRVGVIVHVRRTPGRRGRLVELSPTASFLQLTRHTVVAVDRAGATRQLALLRDLVGQSRSYRLDNGDDLHGCPDRVLDLLARG